MAHHRQAIKRYRNSLENHTRNVSVKSAIKSCSAKLVTLSKEKKSDEAKKILSELYSQIDKAVKYGVLHRKNADRRKSRISKALQVSLKG